MPEIPDLEYIHFEDNADDDDLLIIYDVSAGDTKKVKRGALVYDLVVEGGDHNLGTSEIDRLTTTTDTILSFADGSTLTKMLNASVSPVVPDILAGASQTTTVTVTGALTSDYLSWAMTGELADGLSCQAWISAADTVSFKFYNSTGSTISGASFPAKLVLHRFS